MSSRSATAAKRRVVAGVLVLLSLVLITVYFREPAGGSLHGVQSGGAAVLRPFEVAANRIAAPFRDTYGWFSGLIHAKSENARLRRRLDQIRSRAIQNSTALAENADLKRQLNYIASPSFPQDFKGVTTEVVGRPPSEFDQQITVANGSGSGIRKDDAVVTADGLVGKVSAVTSDQAQVTLLTDPTMAVSALDLNTNAGGIVKHGDAPGTLALDRVQKSAVIRSQDPIVTQWFKWNGLTSIYPAGIPIGTVSDASLGEVDVYWQAQITPSVHFDSLRSVIVLVPKKRLG